MPKDYVRQLLEFYPRIYFACHRRHVRDPRSGGVLSARQGSILDHLDERQPTTLRELARHMGVTDSTMSVQVDRLVRTGFVIRERDAEDPRRRNLRLTRSGVRVREANSVLDEDRIAEMLERLSPEELEKGMAGLALLAKAAGEITPKEAPGTRNDDGAASQAEEEGLRPDPEGGGEERVKIAAQGKRGRVSRGARESRQLRQRSKEEEEGVQEVVRELRKIQQELEEMRKKESGE